MRAIPDAYLMTPDDTLSVAAPGVLANDLGGPDTAELRTPDDDWGPFHGSVTLNSDGSFEYTPESGYKGFDHFYYRASAGSDVSNWSSVTITVGQASEGCTACPCNVKTKMFSVTNQGFLPFINRISGGKANWKRWMQKSIAYHSHTATSDVYYEATITIDPRNGSFIYDETRCEGSAFCFLGGAEILETDYEGFVDTATEDTWIIHVPGSGEDFLHIEVTMANLKTADDLDTYLDELEAVELFDDIPDNTARSYAFNNDLGLPYCNITSIWPGLIGPGGYLDSTPEMSSAPASGCGLAYLRAGLSSAGLSVSTSQVSFFGKGCEQSENFNQETIETDYDCTAHPADICELQTIVLARPPISVVNDFALITHEVTVTPGLEPTTDHSDDPCCG